LWRNNPGDEKVFIAAEDVQTELFALVGDYSGDTLDQLAYGDFHVDGLRLVKRPDDLLYIFVS
jgi:hypothetical protein